jgi:hypothetical protein
MLKQRHAIMTLTYWWLAFPGNSKLFHYFPYLFHLLDMTCLSLVIYTPVTEQREHRHVSTNQWNEVMGFLLQTEHTNKKIWRLNKQLKHYKNQERNWYTNKLHLSTRLLWQHIKKTNFLNQFLFAEFTNHVSELCTEFRTKEARFFTSFFLY